MGRLNELNETIEKLELERDEFSQKLERTRQEKKRLQMSIMETKAKIEKKRIHKMIVFGTSFFAEFFAEFRKRTSGQGDLQEMLQLPDETWKDYGRIAGKVFLEAYLSKKSDKANTA